VTLKSREAVARWARTAVRVLVDESSGLAGPGSQL